MDPKRFHERFLLTLFIFITGKRKPLVRMKGLATFRSSGFDLSVRTESIMTKRTVKSNKTAGCSPLIQLKDIVKVEGVRFLSLKAFPRLFEIDAHVAGAALAGALYCPLLRGFFDNNGFYVLASHNQIDDVPLSAHGLSVFAGLFGDLFARPEMVERLSLVVGELEVMNDG